MADKENKAVMLLSVGLLGSRFTVVENGLIRHSRYVGEGDAMLDSLIFAGGDGLVREVWAAGRHAVRDGRHVERDRIVADYLACIAGLERRM